MTLAPTTKLEAINELLEAIGEAPVNAVANTGLTEADLASTRIDKVSRQVQKRGWHWNTLVNYPIDPDVDGYIILPVATIEVDTSGRSAHKDYVRRGNKLYDRENNTFVISQATTVDITLLLDFEEIPENARDYITMKAARKFQQRMFGSTELSEFDREDEQQALFDLLDAESDVADYNMLRDSLTVSRILNRKHFNKN
jgi:hypothetical protein